MTFYKKLVGTENQLVPFFQNGMEIRYYQQEALVNLEKSRENGHCRGLCYIPTGAGKTFVAFEDALRVLTKKGTEALSKKIFIIVPSDVLRSQHMEALKQFGSQLNIFATTHEDWEAERIAQADAIITTYQFYNYHREKLLQIKEDIGYRVFDEAHHSHANSYQTILNDFEPEFTLGLSATPYSVFEKNGIVTLEEHFENNVVIDYTSEEKVSELIGRGYLADIFVKRAEESVLRFKTEYLIKGENGDFNTQLIYSEFTQAEKDEFNKMIYEEYLMIPEVWKDQLKMSQVFSIEHANDLEKYCNDRGLKFKALHSKINDDKKEVLKQYENNQYDMLLIVDMLKEGYDNPDIGVMFGIRPIYSRHAYMQFMGRGSRRSATKTSCYIVDFPWNLGAYASYTMHTVYRRSQYHPEKTGEHFFARRSGYIPNISENKPQEISLNFMNYFSKINWSKELPVTIAMLTEMKVIDAHKKHDQVIKLLEENYRPNENDSVVYGIQFFKRDVLGRGVWAFNKNDMEKFFKVFSLERMNKIKLTTPSAEGTYSVEGQIAHGAAFEIDRLLKKKDLRVSLQQKMSDRSFTERIILGDFLVDNRSETWENEILDKPLLDRLNQIIKTMFNNTERLILYKLYGLQGYVRKSIQEIAEENNIPRNTLKRWVQRLKNRLRKNDEISEIAKNLGIYSNEKLSYRFFIQILCNEFLYQYLNEDLKISFKEYVLSQSRGQELKNIYSQFLTLEMDYSFEDVLDTFMDKISQADSSIHEILIEKIKERVEGFRKNLILISDQNPDDFVNQIRDHFDRGLLKIMNELGLFEQNRIILLGMAADSIYDNHILLKEIRGLHRDYFKYLEKHFVCFETYLIHHMGGHKYSVLKPTIEKCLPYLGISREMIDSLKPSIKSLFQIYLKKYRDTTQEHWMTFSEYLEQNPEKEMIEMHFQKMNSRLALWDYVDKVQRENNIAYDLKTARNSFINEQIRISLKEILKDFKNKFSKWNDSQLEPLNYFIKQHIRWKKLKILFKKNGRHIKDFFISIRKEMPQDIIEILDNKENQMAEEIYRQLLKQNSREDWINSGQNLKKALQAIKTKEPYFLKYIENMDSDSMQSLKYKLLSIVIRSEWKEFQQKSNPLVLSTINFDEHLLKHVQNNEFCIYDMENKLLMIKEGMPKDQGDDLFRHLDRYYYLRTSSDRYYNSKPIDKFAKYLKHKELSIYAHLTNLSLFVINRRLDYSLSKELPFRF